MDEDVGGGPTRGGGSIRGGRWAERAGAAERAVAAGVPGGPGAAGVPDASGALIGGRYRLGGVLGSGGYASVFEAEDLGEPGTTTSSGGDAGVGRSADVPVAGSRAIGGLANRPDAGGSASGALRPARVAVKIIHPHRSADPVARATFEREARAAASLVHPGIVRVRGWGYHDAGGVKLAWIAEDLVEGPSASAWVRAHGPLGPSDACVVVDAVLAALAAAHARGLVHRDVSPGNVLLDRPRVGRALRRAQVRLTDFGLADLAGRPSLTGADAGLAAGRSQAASPSPLDRTRVLPNGGRTAATGAGLQEGAGLLQGGAAGPEPVDARVRAAPGWTPAGPHGSQEYALVQGNVQYMSPEQARGLPVGPAGDVYQAGALLYFLLTGEPPYPRRTAAEVLRAHVAAPPPVPSALVRVPVALDRVVARAMRKDPAARYPNTWEFRSALTQVQVELAGGPGAVGADGESTREHAEEPAGSGDVGAMAGGADALGAQPTDEVAAAGRPGADAGGGWPDATGEAPGPGESGRSASSAEHFQPAAPEVPGAGDLAYLRSSPSSEQAQPPPEPARSNGSWIAALLIGLIVLGSVIGVAIGAGRSATHAEPPTSASPTLSTTAAPSSAAPSRSGTRAPTRSPSASAPASRGPSASAATPARTTVPALSGTLTDAQAALAAAGLRLGRTSDVASARPAGTVVGQSPAAGASVGSGGAVDVRVASGSNVVPKVAGQSAAAAAALLQSAGFDVAYLADAGEATPGPAYRAVGTQPRAGTMLRLGVTVSVQVRATGASPSDSAGPWPTQTEGDD